jgi:ubiquitin fusion degradation protein 1
MMQLLLIEEGGFITIKSATLQKGNYVKLQPQTSTFLDISNPKAVYNF